MPVRQSLDDLGATARRLWGGRRTRRDDLHLTLLFVGAVFPPRLEVLRAAADGIVAEPFLLRLDRLHCWRRNRIAWAGCRQVPAALLALQTNLADRVARAGFAREREPFLPHVSLLRNATCPAGMGQEDLPQPDIAWPVDNFVLVESLLQADGARYRILDRWPLRLAPAAGE